MPLKHAFLPWRKPSELKTLVARVAELEKRRWAEKVFLRPRRPKGHEKIDEIHCWIVTRHSGAEEILLNAAKASAPPLGYGMAVRREGVTVTAADLRRIQKDSLKTDDPVKSFRLASFKLVE